MFTQEQANTAIAKCDAKIDFFEDLIARIVNTIDEIEMARHDNVLWDFGDNWTLADNVKDGWDATETACEGLGYVREVCERQLTRERNKAEKLEAYGTRLELEATPAEVTATNSVDIEDEEETERDFDETQIDFIDDEDRLNYLSALEPVKAEFKAALRGIYLDTAGYSDEEILPAVDWAQLMAPMYVTDHSTTAYRKNADGTFTEDAAAYKRLRDVEEKMFKFGNPELDDAQADTKVTTNSVDIDDDEEPATEKSPDQIADELTAKLVEKTSGATQNVHTRLQGDRGYRSLILSNLTVKPDWYYGRGYDFINRCEVMARYDTPAQVEEVIARIGAVASFKDTEFQFPHVAELTAPDYHEKRWAVDFEIYHADSDLTEEELRTCTDKLSDAMTANGNRAHVELEDCLISVWGDNGGDNLTVQKIVREMLKRGCWQEYPEDDEYAAE